MDLRVGRRPGHLRLAALLVVAVVVLPAPSARSAEAPAVAPVTDDPACDWTDALGLFPSEARSRTGLDQLVDQQHTGAEIRVAQLQFGAIVDESRLNQYSDCMHVPRLNFEMHVVGTPATALEPSGESMSDAELLAGIAPGVERLDVFVSPSGGVHAATMNPLLEAALDPANTGGHLVDIISISYNTCESEWGDLDSTEAILADAAAKGVWVIKGAGDSGSSGCATKGDCASADTELAVDYPASSPNVIGTGGVAVPDHVDPITPAGDVVWLTDDCAGTGGGASAKWLLPDWQGSVPGGLTSPTRMVPDVASLAGDPGYEMLTPAPSGPGWVWRAVEGDSMTGPVHAAALAIVRGALVANGVPVPVRLGPELYRLASQPDLYASVFHDVTVGNNDTHQKGCCDARTGYDQATGLGELDFSALYAALAIQSLAPVPAVPAPVSPSFTG
jgi:subtilase family serine protease